MASFAKHLPLLLLLIALLPNISAGGSYGVDEYGVSKQEEEEEEEPSFFQNTGDSYGLSYNPSTTMSNDDDDDDGDLRKSLNSYEQGIKYAKLVKNGMNNYGVKVVDNNNDDDDDNGDDGDDSLNKSLEAYARGVNYAKSIKKEDIDNYGVKASNNDYSDNDDGDDSLNRSLEAYARGVNYAKSIKKEDVDGDAVDVEEITSQDKHYYKEDLDDEEEDLP